MKNVTIKGMGGVDAEVKLSAEEWQLYSDMPGAGTVAKQLNGRVEKALKASGTKDKARKHVEDLMFTDLFSKFGACDTEPRDVLECILEAAYPGEL